MGAIAGRVIRVGSLLVFAGVFGLTLLYDLPVNPLVLAGPRWVERGITGVFSQNLTLFAPNPIASDYALLAHPIRSSSAIAPNEPEEWYDLSTPLWEGFRRNRLSPLDRLFRLQLDAMQDCLGDSPKLAFWRRAGAAAEPDAQEQYRTLSGQVRSGALATLTRIASAFVNSALPDRSYDQIALRIRIAPGLPWSKRWTGTPRQFTDIDLGIFPIDGGVTRARFYRSAAGGAASLRK